ncbi:LAGLIDADG family homing endonuclease [Sediminibacillus terrae]|uniref:LAGLIDADG family homing endonuclease n=1 Tax=Sediminibacillus terrae TaxID=1562106 RepID=UPI001EEFD68F|nr:LAGLIDADG family homing endonuclease [Sediminibacillus terrae]
MSKKRKRLLDVKEMVAMYKEGYSTSEIGKAANVTPRYVRTILHANDVSLRPRGSWKRKYTLNEDYFKTWSNNMAYILGFFAADGNLPKDNQTVSFSQKDPDILEKIKKEINSNQPLYQNAKTGVYVLNLNSKILKHDLMELHGFRPNKSAVLEFPEIPEPYLHHFIRGYFDGDGFVNYAKFFVSFVGGSYSFMKKLQTNIEGQGFETNFTNHTNYFRLYISGRKTIKLFSDWLYKDKGLYLERKYRHFQREQTEISLLTDKVKTHKNALAKRKKKNKNETFNNDI